MIIQLSFISALYVIFMLPQVVVGSVQTLWSVNFLADVQANYFYYIVYFINQFLPFIIVSSLPEMRKDIKRWIQYLKQRFIHRTQVYPIGTAIVNRRITVQSMPT
jgi:hypothetical protein